MKVIYEEFDLKTKKKVIDKYIANTFVENYIDEDDKITVEIEVFFGKKALTIKIFERILN
tara:strand:+ start:268 stop:447 length:180 start_codon:yes stop_codon:yes gene_type:complete